MTSLVGHDRRMYDHLRPSYADVFSRIRLPYTTVVYDYRYSSYNAVYGRIRSWAFNLDQAPNFYWEILAERARIKLVDQLRENQQLHELLDELINERGELEEKKQQYENFKNIIEKIMSIKKENNDREENKSSTNGINSLLLFKMLQLVQQKQQLAQEKQQLTEEKQQWLQEKHELLQIIKKE
ncbi:unnamed protein product [Rotaria socialis]